MLFQVNITALADTDTYSPLVKATYTQPERLTPYTVVQGIDVSVHNGILDFAKIKKEGVNFVIMRVGYTGWGEKFSTAPDTRFATYYRDAKAAGLDVGVYFFSQAKTESEAVAEANYTLSLIKGLSMDLPVYFDYEFETKDDGSDGRLLAAWNNGKLNKRKMTDNVKAFCDTIRKGGYVPGLYSNTDWLNNKLYYDELDNTYPIWNAHYTGYSSKTQKYGCTSYPGNLQMWQYSSRGVISGHNGVYFDCNFMYKELMDQYMSGSSFAVSKIKSRAYTGKEIKPALTVTAYGKELVKGEDYYVTFENNIEIGKAYVTVIGVNEYAACKSVRKAFNIVPSKVANLAQTDKAETSISFKWNKHADASKYRIQTGDGTSFTTLADVTGTSYTIKNLSPCQSMYVRVAAVKTIGKTEYLGKYSTPVQMICQPRKVTGIKNTTVKTDSIRLQWTKQAYASHYNIYEYDNAAKKYKLIFKASKNYYTVKKLEKNSKHIFKVRAVKIPDSGSQLISAPSAAFTAYTSPDAPEIVSAASSKEKRITVKWKRAASADGYEIMWSTTKGFTSNFLSVYNTKNTAVTKTLTTSQSNKKYYVHVRSYKLHDGKKVYSSWSKTLSVKVK